jgi:hypothetical protein
MHHGSTVQLTGELQPHCAVYSTDPVVTDQRRDDTLGVVTLQGIADVGQGLAGTGLHGLGPARQEVHAVRQRVTPANAR